jgi:hypothetical protein
MEPYFCSSEFLTLLHQETLAVCSCATSEKKNTVGKSATRWKLLDQWDSHKGTPVEVHLKCTGSWVKLPTDRRLESDGPSFQEAISATRSQVYQVCPKPWCKLPKGQTFGRSLKKRMICISLTQSVGHSRKPWAPSPVARKARKGPQSCRWRTGAPHSVSFRLAMWNVSVCSANRCSLTNTYMHGKFLALQLHVHCREWFKGFIH